MPESHLSGKGYRQEERVLWKKFDIEYFKTVPYTQITGKFSKPYPVIPTSSLNSSFSQSATFSCNYNTGT